MLKLSRKNVDFHYDEFTVNKATSPIKQRKKLVHWSKRVYDKREEKETPDDVMIVIAPLRRSQGINLPYEWSLFLSFSLSICLSRTFHPSASKLLSAFVHLSLKLMTNESIT